MLILASGSLLSAMPLFLAGNFDDFGHSISPKVRVVACVLASIFALVVFETRIASVEIPGVDWLLTFPIFAIFFTVFASTTLAQAYNLIDGLNGLSSGCGLIALTFISIIANQHGSHEIYNFSLIALSCLFGFWFLNIMTGWVFLGDGGAYLIGHLVAWTSIIMASAFENVSPLAFLLATAYPVVEILITVVRRTYLKQPLTVPDSDHFHHLVNRLLSRRLNLSNHVNNSLSSFIILTIQIGCMLHALRFKHHTLACFSVFFLFALTCLILYLCCSKRCSK